MTDSAKPLILVDGSSYLYRAYHALPPLMNAAGEPTGAIYGVVSMLRRLLDDHQSNRIAVVFDAPGRTFRDDLYAEYKANRPPMPEDLAKQCGPLKELVEALGFPLIEIPGVEADDVIGTLAVQAAEGGMSVLISTGDKDMAQLVGPAVTLLNTMSNTSLDREGVITKFGVPPERIIDYLALVGDSSDNIPGVPKVGPKTAAKWLTEYDSLDGIKQNAEAIGGKVGENLRAHLDELDLSRELATIHCTVDLPLRPEELTLNKPDIHTLTDLYQRFGFNSWLRELRLSEDDKREDDKRDTHSSSAAERGSYTGIQTQAELDAWLEKLDNAEYFAFDLETDSLNYMNARIVGVSFAVTPGEAAYLPLGHCGPDQPDQLDREVVLKQLKPLLEDPKRLKVGQNLKYDMSVLANHDISLRGVAHDTMLASYCLDSTASRHDMNSLANKYLNYQPISYEEVAGKGAKQITFDQVALAEAVEYAAEDADITLRLHEHLWPLLRAEERPCQVYQDIEIPLLPVLSRIERTGVRVDPDLLGVQSRELAEKMQEVEQAAHEMAGGPFNLGSPKQIQEILYERQGLPVLSKTPKGAPPPQSRFLRSLRCKAMTYRDLFWTTAVSQNFGQPIQKSCRA